MLAEGICIVGVLWLRSAFDQLHFSGAASTVPLVFFAVAVGLTGFSSISGTIDCLVALALTFMINPVLVSAMGRFGRRQRFGSLQQTPAEFEQQP
jgi:multisubunit Na+/H+ antiporter MnhG subunit